ncbi:MAG: glycoside hydrolase family 57 protein [Deltaproteobacteria bacterium]|nr:glycoside hydrolase family 57 protein [Deltaproteobacteria bacterium]
MPGICFYFQVHQPLRLRHYSYFDIDHVHAYGDMEQNRAILNKVSEKCYLPANRMMFDLIERHEGAFRIAYSLSGILLDQLETYRPDVLDSFRQLADTGCVEFLNETYYHSLAFIFSPEEFKKQVMLHKDRIKTLFGQTADTFRHTEFIYNNDLAAAAEDMGYKCILTEGADKILGWRSPDFVYQPQGCRHLKLLLRNYRLSDDIAFRFSNRQWPEYPLTVDKYAHWIHKAGEEGRIINLFMDYETFGEHQWQETGIFEFMKNLPDALLKQPGFQFQTPREIAADQSPVASLDVPQFISWADVERNLTAWLGNALQRDASRTLYDLEQSVVSCGDEQLLHIWRCLQTSDHLYYMCTKWFSDGDVHKYFNPYPSPYDAYINFMNIMDDFSRQLDKKRSNDPNHINTTKRSLSNDNKPAGLSI